MLKSCQIILKTVTESIYITQSSLLDIQLLYTEQKHELVCSTSDSQVDCVVAI